MTIEVFWGDPEETILQARFIGDWTWEAYNLAIARIVAMTSGRDQRIDRLIDMRESGAVPHGSVITHIQRGGSLVRLKQRGITVIVGANAIIQGSITALKFSEVDAPKRIFTTNIESALAIIQASREEENSPTSS